MGKAIFREENIVLGAKAADKWQAIRMCGQILVDQGYVTKEYIEDMIAREEGATVYVGNHVAIPHGVANSESNIIESGISFLQVPDGIEFGSEKAYMLIGIAGKDGSHIEILGNIAMICSDMDNVMKLKETTQVKEVYNIFSEML